MILLDTNVVSEPLRPAGDVGVLNWLDAQTIETLYLSAISLAELRFGIAALAPGKRRDALNASLEQRILHWQRIYRHQLPSAEHLKDDRSQDAISAFSA